jgi:hypothetical protein
VRAVGGAPTRSYWVRISWAQAMASLTQMAAAWSRVQGSPDGCRLADRCDDARSRRQRRCRPSNASATRMCSNTYGPLTARGCPRTRTMRYPALCRVRPPLQLPLASADSFRHMPQVADFTCFVRPHSQVMRARQTGHRRCRLDGRKTRSHCWHRRPRTP